MADSVFDDDWVDRFVRAALSPEEEARFEERLMVDAGLQAKVEAALALQQALLQTRDVPVAADVEPALSANPWGSWALAASVVLAVTATLLAWRGSVETDRLRQEIAQLRSPATSILAVPVDIMRSAGNATPDVIIQKPATGLVVLDIEITPALGGLALIGFELSTEGGESLQSWRSPADPERRARVALRADDLPDGRLVLRIFDPDSSIEDRRLIELRPAP